MVALNRQTARYLLSSLVRGGGLQAPVLQRLCHFALARALRCESSPVDLDKLPAHLEKRLGPALDNLRNAQLEDRVLGIANECMEHRVDVVEFVAC